jgi:hypothetical protein
LRLALQLGLKASLSIGVDGLFGEVVGTTASWWGWELELARSGSLGELLQLLTETEGAPAKPAQETSISMPISNPGSDSFNSWLGSGFLTK